MATIKVSSPATVANLVCGFDILGLCINEPADIMEVALLKENTIVIRSANGYPLPLDPLQNTAGAPLVQMLKECNINTGFEIIIYKSIKPGSGLGSSAASAAGAVVAANHLLGNIFDKKDLVRFAMFGEEVASGVQHADNVAPCIYGGVTLIRSMFPLDIIVIPAPPLYITVIHPQIEIRTADARKILPERVLLKDAVKQWGNVAGLVAGLMKSDYELIGRSLEDVIVEPARSVLIPGFNEIKKQCKEAGALGGGISGSGPSLFMLSMEKITAEVIEKVMKNVYDKIGIDYHTYVTAINYDGVKIIE
ncbi:MAG: homoserine kinase [Chitinophagaceae bacterium]|nr:homoserine kinase [Chitinophagaceae bacterium]